MLRNVSTFILEILPYALASLIGAFLLAGHLGALPVRGEASRCPPCRRRSSAFRPPRRHRPDMKFL